MDAGILGSPKRWRTFADGVATVLGVNVWISVILLPGVFVGAWKHPTAQLAAAVPLAALVIGLWRRSEAVLLLGFPSALLVPAALHPAIVAAPVYGPIRFTLVSLGLIAYLLGVSLLTSFREPPPPERVRPLTSAGQPTPPRWRRRTRVYFGLTILSAIFPAVLLWAVNFDADTREFVFHNYTGKTTALTTLLDLGLVAFWLLIYWWIFLGALRLHRTGDRELTAELTRLRVEAARGRPRPVFYVGVAAALVFMIALLAIRYG